MIRLSLPSNAVNAIYVILFDLAVPLLVTIFVHILLASRNLKVIYEDRKPLQLKPLRIPSLIDQGLSHVSIARLAAITSTVSVVLAMAGGFAFTGVSRRTVVDKTVPAAIVAATAGTYIDFTEHVSKDGNRVSASFLAALQGQECRRMGRLETVIFSSFITIPDLDLDEVNYEMRRGQINSTCRLERYGYVQTMIINQTRLEHLPPIGACSFTVDRKENGTLHRAEATLNGTCPLTLHDTWCSTTVKTFCIALVQFETFFSTIVVEYVMEDGQSLETLFYRGRAWLEFLFLPQRPDSIVLQNMAYLLSTGVVPWPLFARQVAMSTVERNAKVGEYDVSEHTLVNEAVFLTTAGAALCFVVAFACAAFSNWRQFVAKPGRRGYNKFTSPEDMLSCALVESVNDGTCRYKNGNGAVVRLENGRPILFHPKPEGNVGK